MRLQLTTIAALAASTALAAGLAGCGGSDESLPVRTISFQGASKGLLKSRADDMRRAAQLGLEATNSNTKGSRLKLVDGPDRNALAMVDALSSRPVAGEEQLTIYLVPPFRRSVAAPPQGSSPPLQIWLLPPLALGEAAKRSYAASGITGAAGAVAVSSVDPGTPAGQYVTPGLSAENYPPAGEAFFEKFEDKYGREPDPYAIYAYEAIGLTVDALTRLEEAGEPFTQKSIAESALSIRDRYSPVGHYDVLPSGQTTLYLFQARGKSAPSGDAALIEALR
ncbi:MAG: hypothetical protein ACRDKE_07690 [Solirubrobacterales bacterium]